MMEVICTAVVLATIGEMRYALRRMGKRLHRVEKALRCEPTEAGENSSALRPAIRLVSAGE